MPGLHTRGRGTEPGGRLAWTPPSSEERSRAIAARDKARIVSTDIDPEGTTKAYYEQRKDGLRTELQAISPSALRANLELVELALEKEGLNEFEEEGLEGMKIALETLRRLGDIENWDRELARLAKGKLFLLKAAADFSRQWFTAKGDGQKAVQDGVWLLSSAVEKMAMGYFPQDVERQISQEHAAGRTVDGVMNPAELEAARKRMQGANIS